MKIGVISDIHGNFAALQAVISVLDSLPCDKILCLGDVCGYYSQINECINLLKQKQVITIKGNHDSYLSGESICSRSDSVNRCIAYQRNVITADNLQWIANLPLRLLCSDLCAVHGGWNHPLDEYVSQFDFEKIPPQYPRSRIFLSGHTHIPALHQKHNILYLNPGSVGQPRNYDARAAFAIIDNGTVSLHRVTYDIEQTVQHMRSAGFDEYFYKNLYYGCKIGQQPI